MMKNLSILLQFNNNLISCTADFEIENCVEYSFLLNKDLQIKSIFCNEIPIDYSIACQVSPLFRCKCNQMSIKNTSFNSHIRLEYNGNPCKTLNAITKNVTSLNFYSVWFPQDLTQMPSDGTVKISSCKDCTVVKGRFNCSSQLWEYGGMGFDPFNIIIYKNADLKLYESSHLNIYGTNSFDNGEAISEIYDDIFNYYTQDLFCNHQINKLDIACLSPAVCNEGNFKRKDLIVCNSLEGINPLSHKLAHELAHEWCCGADCFSWHDWLNETTAEWAALLYANSRKNNDLFEYILQPHLKLYANYPPIKSLDGLRPEGVHTKGTVLFYKVFQAYGANTVASLIKIFATLNQCTTENFISEVRLQLGENIYDMLMADLE